MWIQREPQAPLTDTDDIEIFGAHKTREQIKTEEKARKKAEREAMRRELEARRAAASTQEKPQHKEILTVVLVLVVIIALGAGALIWQFHRTAQAEKFMQDDTRATHFVVSDATPEMVADGVKAAIAEAYYTKGGYVYVRLVLGNGTNYNQELTAIDVTLYNEADQQVAGGRREETAAVVIAAGGTAEYEFYISPEHVQITDDPLTTLGYTVNVTTVPAE